MITKIASFLILPLFILFAINMSASNKQQAMQEIETTNLKPEFAIEGKIVFQSNVDGDNEIYMISEQSIIKLTDNTWEDEYPVWSHDGKKIAFTANPQGNYDIFVMNSDGSEITPITSSDSDEKGPAWFPDGKRIGFTKNVKSFFRKKQYLYAIDIVTKNTNKIIPKYSKTHAIANVSPTKPLITFTGKRMRGWDAAIYDINKNEVKFLDEGGKSCRARFSKDGNKLAYVSSKADNKGDIWLMNPDGSQKMRLTERDETYDYFPSWSPDGKYIVFNSSLQHDHNGDWQLYIIEVKSRKTSLLFDSPGNDAFPDWQ